MALITEYLNDVRAEKKKKGEEKNKSYRPDDY